MQLILLQDVENVGLRGDVVDVARGYARNFLLPRRLAEEATPARLGELEKRDSHRARHEAATTEQAGEIQKVLEQAELRFEMKAGPTGSLFGSVTATDIADELWEKHKVRVDRRKIELPQPIKHVGRYAVPVGIFEDVQAEVATLVRRPRAASCRRRSRWSRRGAGRRGGRGAGRGARAAEAPEGVDEHRGARGRRGAADEACPPHVVIHKACGGLWNIARTSRVERPFRPPCRPGHRRQWWERDVLFSLQIECAEADRGGRGFHRFPPVETRRLRGVNTAWLK